VNAVRAKLSSIAQQIADEEEVKRKLLLKGDNGLA
jgi:hypothetical protein